MPIRGLSTQRISGSQHKLPLLLSYAVRREDYVFHTMSHPVSDGESGLVETVLTNARSNDSAGLN